MLPVQLQAYAGTRLPWTVSDHLADLDLALMACSCIDERSSLCFSPGKASSGEKPVAWQITNPVSGDIFGCITVNAACVGRIS